MEGINKNLSSDSIDSCLSGYPPVIKHGLLENGPFIGDFPIKTSIPRGFSTAMFDYQRIPRHRSLQAVARAAINACDGEGRTQTNGAANSAIVSNATSRETKTNGHLGSMRMRG